MSSLLETLQTQARLAASTSGHIAEDLHAFFDIMSITAGHIDERVLAWVQTQNALINDATAAWQWMLENSDQVVAGYLISIPGAVGEPGVFDETTGTSGVIGTATTNLPDIGAGLTWSIVAGGDADISINSSTGAVSSARAIYSGDSAVFTVQVTNGTLTIGFPFTATGTVAAYSAEATALFTRFTSDPGTTRKGHIDTLITALKSAGVWAKLDALYILAAHDSQAACRNWIADSYNLTPNNSPTFTTDRGYTGNGSNMTLSTGFIPSSASSPKYVQNSGTLGAWALTTITGLNEYIIGSSTSNVAGFNPRSSVANTLRGILNRTTALENFSTNTTSAGLSILTRTSNNATTYYQNITSKSTSSNASTGVPAVEIILLGFNSTASNHQIAVGFIGSGFNSTEVTDTYNALNTFLTAIGAI